MNFTVYTTATTEDFEEYFRSNKKLKRKMTIVETSCHTLIQRGIGFMQKAGYCFTITDRGNLREISIDALAVRGRAARRTGAIVKSLYEMIYAVENFRKVGK